MSERDDGGPAFPSEGEGHGNPLYHSPGMTLRDYFAASALPWAFGLDYGNGWGRAGVKHIPHATRTAYEVADAMLAEKKRREGGA